MPPLRAPLHLSYLLIIALLTAVVPCVLIALATSTFYYRHSMNQWDTLEEHHFNVQGRNADILLIGDSALVHGVSPREVAHVTQRSVYNLGLPMPALLVDRDLLLRRYLAHNKAPEWVVLYLSAATRRTPPFAFPPIWYEGETMLLRYGKPAEVVDFFRSHPAELSRFAALAGRKVVRFAWSEQHYLERAHALDEQAGFYPLPMSDVNTIQASDCQLTRFAIVPDSEFIAGFRREAAALGLKAAVYLAPIPDCDRHFAATTASYAGLIDNVPYTLPHRLFMDDPMMEHLIVAGAEQNSRILGAFLNHLTAQTNPTDLAQARTAADGKQR